MGEDLVEPEYATLVGLAVYGNRRRLLRDAQESGFLARLWRWLRGKGEAD